MRQAAVWQAHQVQARREGHARVGQHAKTAERHALDQLGLEHRVVQAWTVPPPVAGLPAKAAEAVVRRRRWSCSIPREVKKSSTISE